MIKNLLLRISIPLMITLLVAINFAIQYIIPAYSIGIHPRTVYGLIGIITSPFFHGDKYHLIGNLSIFWLLGILFYLKQEIWKSNVLLACIWIVQGLLVWLIGRDANHIGLSGTILGLFGYMLANLILCWEWKNLWKLVISAIAIYWYAELLPQVFNMSRHISFEGHIAGFLTGIFFAKIALLWEKKQ